MSGPMIDMRVALTNPYTLDKFNVVRRNQVINNDGEVQITPTTFNNVRGVVTPSVQQKDLQRMSDAQLMTKALTIVTMFGLRGASEDVTKNNFQPDIIVWNSDTFAVVFVDDYSNYARGFVRSVAVMMDISAVPTVIGKAVASLGGPSIPSLGPGLTQHAPVEMPDGVRSTFTFLGLPSDGSYQLVWDGTVQGGFTQSGDQITLGSTPQGVTPVPNATDQFYALW
jgi:hypothetical protein